ncbi:MAG TPA: protein kinase [Gemmataceae bacterium]|jgi:serine/threonine protein kinase
MSFPEDGTKEEFQPNELENTADLVAQIERRLDAACGQGGAASPIVGLPGRQLGEYDVLERLGSGGMGEVYKARHRRLGKLVALKVLPAGSQNSHERAARFQREMQAVGQLEHPNVVEAHDAGEQSGVVYLAMKLIDGVDLDRLVEQRGPLPIVEACEMIRQAALGLHYLHERDLVHRDVKPSNLMRTSDGTVKVLDLGLARWCIEGQEEFGLTGTGRGMGTPDFLAPEQIESAADADVRADLYGLGGTLFYLLTGRPPFAHHSSSFSKLQAHRSEPPPDVRTLRPEVTAELAALVQRLLAKKPEDRLTTAAEVAVALAPLAGVPGPLTPSPTPALPPTTGKAKPRKPRWPWFAAAGASLILVMILLLSTLFGLVHPPDSSPTQSSDQSPGPAHVMKLDVRLTRNVNGFGLPAGLLGGKVFDPHLGDTVTVDAQLTQPAYAFLIAFRPDGKVDVCFPEKEDEMPPLTDNPRYPSTAVANGEFGLTDGTGLQAFAVAVSSQPLPAFKEWCSQCENCPWQKADAPPGVVYRIKGQDPVEAWSATGEARGKGVELKGKTPLANLASWLRKAPGIETVQVLGFAVMPKEKR